MNMTPALNTEIYSKRLQANGLSEDDGRYEFSYFHERLKRAESGGASVPDGGEDPRGVAPNGVLARPLLEHEDQERYGQTDESMRYDE
jgi:hypothetical protein